MDELFLSSYYWSFDPTGVLAVDRILEAIARAGKAYHSTERWDEAPYGEEDGPCYWERIQNAANACAEQIKEMEF